MLQNMVLAVLCFFSAVGVGALDLRSLNLESKCKSEGDKETWRVIYDADQRSVDVICKVTAAEELINHKIKRQSKAIDQRTFEKEVGIEFRGLYYNTEVISGGKTSEPKYKEFRLGGKLIGYRGIVTVSNGKDLNAILGAYYTADKKGKIKDLAKVFVIDRSKIVPTSVPADLKPALDVFESLVVPADKQGLWALTAEVVRLPGKDANYGTSNILMKLAENLGGIGVYKLVFDSLKNVKDPGKFILASSGDGSYGAFCENLIVDGTPLNEDDFQGDDGSVKYGKACEAAVDNLIKKVSTAAVKTHAYMLYSELDEEQRGYLLIPSNQRETEDSFLKVYFDISHNE